MCSMVKEGCIKIVGFCFNGIPNGTKSLSVTFHFAYNIKDKSGSTVAALASRITVS